MDPAPREVWCGPYATLEAAERAAGFIRKHGFGCGAMLEQIDGARYARSVGAAEPGRTADAIARIARDRSARVGLRGAPFDAERIRQLSVGNAQRDRRARMH